MSKLNEIIRQAVQREFGSFLAHDPFDPEKFWGGAAGGIERALLDATGGPHHLLRIKDYGAWTMQHPLDERFEGTLFSCTMPQLVGAAVEEGHITGGLYRVWMDRGTLQWESP